MQTHCGCGTHRLAHAGWLPAGQMLSAVFCWGVRQASRTHRTLPQWNSRNLDFSFLSVGAVSCSESTTWWACNICCSLQVWTLSAVSWSAAPAQSRQRPRGKATVVQNQTQTPSSCNASVAGLVHCPSLQTLESLGKNGKGVRRRSSAARARAVSLQKFSHSLRSDRLLWLAARPSGSSARRAGRYVFARGGIKVLSM